MGPEIDLERALAVARRAAEAAEAVSRRYFKGTVPVETKPDGSPVTAADKECDAAIVAVIRASFPDHAILTEESGLLGDAEAPYCWIVDPIDGTQQFLEGRDIWGHLVALARGADILAGAIRLPAVGGELWAARGLGAFRDGKRLAVTRTADWGRARAVYRSRKRLRESPEGPSIQRLFDTSGRVDYVVGLGSPLEVVQGTADAWIDAGSKIWDLAAPKAILEEAGGRMTHFDGSPRLDGGLAVATNGRLHAHVVAALRTASSTG